MKPKARPAPPTRTLAEPAEDPLPDPVENLVEDLALQDFMPSHEETVLDECPELSQHAILQSRYGDEAGVENGDRIARVPLEDETKPSELLVRDGLNEADEELREMDEEEDESSSRDE